MVFFPNSKINLGLRVLGRRTDGYHDLDTIFYPISLKDAAEIVPSTSNSEKDINLHLSGIQIEGNNENICVKAFRLLKQHYPQIPSCRMYLHKAIPPGAGLGGGSSDAAFTLAALNKMLVLNIDSHTLEHYALQLGSDCPFFLLNKPCHATGRGENMKEVKLQLEEYEIMLVNPALSISTAWAFSELAVMRQSGKQQEHSISTFDAVSQPIESWKDVLVNDFELPVFQRYPELGSIKQKLYDVGAIYASLTGTGSCIYAIFPKGKTPAHLQLDSNTTLHKLNPLA